MGLGWTRNYSRVQGLQVMGVIKLEGCKYWAHSVGKVITMRVITLLAFSFCCGGHLAHCIYLGLPLYLLTSIFWYNAVIALSVIFMSGVICRWTVMENCLFMAIKKGLGVRHKDAHDDPFYPTRYFCRQVLLCGWVQNCQRVWYNKHVVLEANYGLRGGDSYFQGLTDLQILL